MPDPHAPSLPPLVRQPSWEAATTPPTDIPGKNTSALAMSSAGLKCIVIVGQ